MGLLRYISALSAVAVLLLPACVRAQNLNIRNLGVYTKQILKSTSNLQFDAGATVTGDYIPSFDSSYTVGSDAFRILLVSADTVDSEQYYVQNAGHSAHMTFLLDGSSNVEWRNTSGTRTFAIGNAFEHIVYDGGTGGLIRPNSDGVGAIGKQDTFEFAGGYFKTVIADDAFVVQSSESAEYKTCNSLTFKWPLCTLTGELSASGGLSGLTASASMWLGNSAGAVKIDQYIATGDRGIIDVYNDQDNIAVKIFSDNSATDDGKIEVNEGDGTLAARISGSDSTISLIDDATGVAGLILGPNGMFVGQNTVASASLTLYNSTNSGFALVTTNTIGSDISVRVVGPIEIASSSSAGDGEGAMLTQITKDSAATIEADNFAISPDGNFYGRTVSGTISCSGVDDGWWAFRTDVEKVVVCLGGAAWNVALSSGS